MLKLLFFFAIVVTMSQCLETIYEWKFIDYLWDSSEQQQWYLKNNRYVYQSIVPIDVDLARGKIIIIKVLC